ncbi:unnamed protein product [Cyclocybe aegerita]|uniref:Protein kinase domain-containing protein n=1 Tax=Cyclocybe aegerita TaxID=1973307 RepID=A0A8S0WVL7_CYCAE|nr:unnamed protein product [Cyclocybe aegerita]
MGRIAATDLMPDFTGRSLDHGRFQLLESLGSGAYGKVYRAIDTSGPTSKPKICAIKCLNKPSPGTKEDLLQTREFANHKLVSGHPNIVTFHDRFYDGLFVYVVLDLVVGGDLFGAITEKHLFQKNGRLIKSAFIKLIDAVQHCHDMGVFHRDIKPENVLCSNDGTDIRLADFGLSIKSPVCQDFGCGSSYYMSPECIGRDIDADQYSTRHNDVWALGVILTNMITGRNPWRYATSDDDCFAAYMRNNDFLQQVLPISSEVNRILKKIFTINPLRRITLPQLRNEILELNAFFIAEQELLSIKTPLHVEITTEVEQFMDPMSAPYKLNLVPAASNVELVDSDEYYVFASPNVDDFVPKQRPVAPPAQTSPILQSSCGSDFIIVGSTESLSVPASASSGPESQGPTTPAARAVDLPVDISPVCDDVALGDPLVVSIMGVPKFKAATPGPKTKAAKVSTAFRSAVQRIKGLSGGSSSS